MFPHNLYQAFTNIHEKITRVWLAKNEYIFHVTREQSYNARVLLKL